MLKWLLLLAIAYGVFRWWSRARPARPSRAARRNPEKMIACAKCGIHVPQSEAVHGKDHSFCSEQHRDSWTQSR